MHISNIPYKYLSGNIIESNRFKRRQGKTSLQERLGYYKCHRLAMVVSNGDNGITNSNGDRREHYGTISGGQQIVFSESGI